jgi:transposase-like protein
VDETFIRVQGQWQYLYRALDRDGNLVDVRLSDTRDLVAAEAFFRSAWTVTGVLPDRITTDGHDAYPRAIRTVFGERVTHRTNRYLNNHLEQDHRGSNSSTDPRAGSNLSPQLHVSVAPSMNSAPFSGPGRIANNPSRLSSPGASIKSNSST